MLYVFFGSDRKRAVKKFHEAITAFSAKNPTGDIFRFDEINFSLAALDELVLGRGLFGQKLLVALSDLLSDAAWREQLEKRLPALAESFNIFLLLDRELPASILKTIEKAGAKTFEFEAEDTVLRPAAFNIFKLTDALGERARQKLWLLYEEALARGLAPEEVFWKLVWQTKMMLLIQKSGGNRLVSVKPFVAIKARRFLRNFKEEELTALSGALVALWHDSRRGLTDFEVGLERLILSV